MSCAVSCVPEIWNKTECWIVFVFMPTCYCDNPADAEQSREKLTFLLRNLGEVWRQSLCVPKVGAATMVPCTGLRLPSARSVFSHTSSWGSRRSWSPSFWPPASPSPTWPSATTSRPTLPAQRPPTERGYKAISLVSVPVLNAWSQSWSVRHRHWNCSWHCKH